VLHEHHLHDLLGVTDGDHADWLEPVAAAEHAGRVTSDDRDAPQTGVPHRLRCASAMPRNASHADLRGNFLECGAWHQDPVHPCSWVTDLRGNTGTG
jgi:hypothetical protein